jgi:signal transduction histidine kinase
VERVWAIANSLTKPRSEVWTRRELVVAEVLPYTLLVVATVITVVVRGGWSRTLAIDLALAAAAGAWTLVMHTLHPAWRREGSRQGAVFFLGFLALAVALVVHAPWFGFYTLSGYLYAYQVLAGNWKLAGLAAVAVIQATSQVGGLPGADPAWIGIWILAILINILLLGVFAYFAWAGDRHRARLEEANRRLEASLRENAGLQRQLLAQAREAGVFDERQRMAREIHDTLAQGLTGIITQLQAADHAGAPDGEWRRHLNAASRLARESLSEARRSVHALRPEALENARLPEVLVEVGEEWSRLSSVPAQVTTTGVPRPMPPEIESALLRTAQEALTNVAKHARATRVGLTLSYMEDLVTLDVRDDGVGFAPPNGSGPPRGFGLTGMRERLGIVAGSLEIESEPGAGTAISATVPTLSRVAER